MSDVKIEKGMLRKFVTYYKPYKKLFFMDLLVATISALCDLVYPMITRNVVNRVIAYGNLPNKNVMCLLDAILGAFSRCRYASRYEERCI